VNPGRRAVAERVDQLVREHAGAAFIRAVEGFAAELDEEGRALLGEILLERAGEGGALDYGLLRRIDEPRWNLFGKRPREPGRP
jgi:hypothetical protein